MTQNLIIKQLHGVEGWYYTADTNRRYNTVLFLQRIVFFSVSFCPHMKHTYCHTPPDHIIHRDVEKLQTKYLQRHE